MSKQGASLAVRSKVNLEVKTGVSQMSKKGVKLEMKRKVKKGHSTGLSEGQNKCQSGGKKKGQF